MTPRSFPKLVLALVWLLAGALAQNNADQQPPGPSTCDSATTMAAMRACENARYQTAGREMDAAYDALLKGLNGEQKHKLLRAQKAWLRFREANAAFEASTIQGGTLAPLVKISVLTKMTSARTEELRRQSAP